MQQHFINHLHSSLKYYKLHTQLLLASYLQNLIDIVKKMGSGKYSAAAIAATSFLFVFLFCMPSNAQLSTSFYDQTCPDLQSTVKTQVRTSISAERRMAGSLIRLHFHDCFVRVCMVHIINVNNH